MLQEPLKTQVLVPGQPGSGFLARSRTRKALVSLATEKKMEHAVKTLKGRLSRIHLQNALPLAHLVCLEETCTRRCFTPSAAKG